ncbi:class A beta-lactamase [Porphyrobacter sp. HT-58-2]|uniref:class A beta-lactamase n=1 Tax=Porphyrobacter sp. HT-58-2 TaxID=2023229 RepID=UPI000CDBFA50|nr:class A beta-lactamase [Porphyrobacter sp. HT-58-2]AUX68886.1 class A beta-lactamase [Porphyrobacter sp. HT-58-2]
MMIDRRFFIGGSLALGASACIPPDQSPIGRLAAELRIIEAAGGGTLGVEIYDTVSGMAVGINRDRRFGHASSFKFSLAALLLQRHAAGLIDADRRVTWSEADLLAHAPFTRERLATGATLRELARATQVTSDNPAANILLRNLGGPAGLTAFWRSIGDEVSRVDRYEPEMNNVPTAEFRDTTTPAAMARTVAKIVYGDVLPEAERAELKRWMVETQTGLKRVRAGLPEGWVAGDKTGTSGLIGGTEYNYIDIGFAEGPKGQPPLTFACYFRARQSEDSMQPIGELTLSRVGKVIKEFAEPERGLPIVGKIY